jgi:3-oxoacyl-(acyl-carrier-protein) synthase
MIESLESALARHARIYAEIIGAEVNCGGQRHGGSITAPNPVGVQRCIKNAVKSANISSSEIDMINGHLTATMADTIEIFNWQQALELEPACFPYINSTKSLIGHALGAAGSIEIVGCILQLLNGFIHASVNCEDLHPKLAAFENRIVRETIMSPIHTIAKASFGFGDVNSCLILRKWYE